MEVKTLNEIHKQGIDALVKERGTSSMRYGSSRYMIRGAAIIQKNEKSGLKMIPTSILMEITLFHRSGLIPDNLQPRNFFKVPVAGNDLAVGAKHHCCNRFIKIPDWVTGKRQSRSMISMRNDKVCHRHSRT